MKDQHPEDLAAGTRMLGGIGQLHFGWYGGLPVRIVYGLLGLALCVVTSSGVTIWLARRRDRGRAVPQWERLWAAVAWGQPLALVLAALAAIALPSGATSLWTWLGATLALLIGLRVLRLPAPVCARSLRLALGLALVALGACHLFVSPISHSGLCIDVVLLVAGAGLSLPRIYIRVRNRDDGRLQRIK